MSHLFPCPNAECEHWNPVDRKSCWSCKTDLGEVDGQAAARAHSPRSRTMPILAGYVAVVLACVAGWWFFTDARALRDTEAPRLVVDQPAAESVTTNRERLEVKGRVDDAFPARVEAGEVDSEGVETAEVVDGAFRMKVPVSFDGGRLRIVAYDKAGNASRPVEFDVAVDRVEPEITLLEPQNGAVVVTRTVVISGEANEPLSGVSVQGEPGEVEDNRFRAEVDLAEGGNTLLLTITDGAGNVTERSLSVTHQQRRLPAGFTSTGRTATGHEVFTAAKDGGKLVLVPGGRYARGSDEGDSDESPQRDVEVSSFFIELTPVTNAQYAKFVAATGARTPSAPSFRSDYFTAVPDGPVVNVSWEDARAYADWAGRILPTEAQWELAARGSASLKWPWGNEGGEAGVHFNGEGDADGFPGASPVGSFPEGASPYGVLDMAGNVWEWTADRYSASYFRNAPEKDPPGPSSGSQRSLRGGAYTSGLNDVRCANRYRRGAGDRVDNVGFRTAAVFPE